MASMSYNKENFFSATYCVFKGCKFPKNKKIDYYSVYGSRYIYGSDKKGDYVIRISNHWSLDTNEYRKTCRNVASCYWVLNDNKEKKTVEYRAGKAYFKDFKPVKWR
jgi:hypothetical protein